MEQPPNFPPLLPSHWTRTECLAGDASSRRYSRVWDGDQLTAILVEYPESIRNQLGRDLEVLRWGRERGLRVPEVFASDLTTGSALLEDLGPIDAEATLETTEPRERTALVARTLEPLEVLAACDPDELPNWNPPLDRTRMRWELAGFELWYVQHHRSLVPSPTLGRWLDELATEIGGHPVRVCHRDYHLNNLLMQRDGATGVIDIQDILVGPDTYDVVSLIYERAAGQLLSAEQREEILEVWAETTDPDPGWRERAAMTRLQRGLKVLGTFARFVVAGQQRYRPWLDELAHTLSRCFTNAGAPRNATAFLLD